GSAPRTTQAQLPGQIVGVDGDAMTADARAGVEGEKPEGLGGSGVDHLTGAYTQAAAHERELVRQGDVDVPEDVLVELGKLGHLRARDLDDLADDLAIEQDREPAAGRGDPADDLWDVADLEGRVAGVDPLG